MSKMALRIHTLIIFQLEFRDDIQSLPICAVSFQRLGLSVDANQAEQR